MRGGRADSIVPVQGIFQFHSGRQGPRGKKEKGGGINAELENFFQHFFGIDIRQEDLRQSIFPTFEEALGILELAMSREESFRGLDYPTLFKQGSRIRGVRQALILLIAIILDQSLQQSKDLHNRLIARLVKEEIVKKFDFLSLNYDILIDNALVAQYELFDLDYGVQFTNFDNVGSEQWHRPDPENSVRLLKLHGSLNLALLPNMPNDDANT